MTTEITNEEKSEMESVAWGLSNASISEGLQFLLEREKVLLEQSDMGEGEAREITIHNMTILLAAAARISEMEEKDR